MRLVIGIPTYNRLSSIQRLLDSIVVAASVKTAVNYIVRIYNNCSDDDQYDVLVLKYKKYLPIEYSKNRFNIGPTLNILKIFYEAEGDWLSIIGDDDRVNPNYFHLIENEINKYNCKNVCAIKFKTDLDADQQNLVITGEDQLLEYLSDRKRFGSFILISSWLYKIDTVRNFIRFSALYSGLQMPHVIPIFYAVREGKMVVVSPESPIVWMPASNDSNWSASITYALMTLTSVIFPFTRDCQKSRRFLRGAIGSSIKLNFKFLILVFSTSGKTVAYRIASIIAGTNINSRIAVTLFMIVEKSFLIKYVAKLFNIHSDESAVTRM